MECPRSNKCNASVCPASPYDGLKVPGERGCPQPKYAVAEMLKQVPYLSRLKKRKLKPFIKNFRLDHDSLLLSYAEFVSKFYHKK